MGTLVRQARRRIVGNQLFAQGANASSVALGAFILLLLFGTEILSWPVALSVPLAAAGLGLYRVRKQMPSRYAVAQLIDRRLGLADFLSTALFFHEIQPEANVPAEIRRAQFEEAGRVAQGVDVRRAVPYTLPRGAYLMGALAIVAGSLFALRYGLSRELDLKQPIANFLPESLRAGKAVRQANNAKRNPPQAPLPADDGSVADNQDEQKAAEPEPAPPAPTPNDAQSDPMGKLDAKSIPMQKQGDQADTEMASDDAEAQGDSTNSKGEGDDKDGPPGESKGGKSDKQKEGAKQDSKESSDSSSLMSKMKDAFQNLLSMTKPQQQNDKGNAQQGKDQKSAQSKSQSGSKQNGKDEKGQNGQQQADSEGEDGQEAKNSDNAQQGKGQGKSDSQQSSKQPGTGVGSQDGDKAIKNAEQLAAMGKLSEIMGKRSAAITGEATVEVQNTSQQLHTKYEQKGTQHTQGGAEISRDEVPVALQPYVQQYFEQVRKQAAAAPAVKK
ncbi:MAG: hypothetical protein ABI759_32290 [Candidatus Solibacter sp.]